MNGPIFGNMGVGGGAGEMADPQTMAAVKNVSLDGQSTTWRRTNPSTDATFSRQRAWLSIWTDAKCDGVMSCEDRDLGDNGFCAWGGLWALHGIRTLS